MVYSTQWDSVTVDPELTGIQQQLTHHQVESAIASVVNYFGKTHRHSQLSLLIVPILNVCRHGTTPKTLFDFLLQCINYIDNGLENSDKPNVDPYDLLTQGGHHAYSDFFFHAVVCDIAESTSSSPYNQSQIIDFLSHAFQVITNTDTQKSILSKLQTRRINSNKPFLNAYVALVGIRDTPDNKVLSQGMAIHIISYLQPQQPLVRATEIIDRYHPEKNRSHNQKTRKDCEVGLQVIESTEKAELSIRLKELVSLPEQTRDNNNRDDPSSETIDHQDPSPRLCCLLM